jgi:hypothetical protein
MHDFAPPWWLRNAHVWIVDFLVERAIGGGRVARLQHRERGPRSDANPSPETAEPLAGRGTR